MLTPRMKAGKHTSELICAMLKERSLIEEEYSKKLLKLSKSFHLKDDIGLLRDPITAVKLEIESTARNHLEISTDIRTNLEKPLCEFIGAQNAVRKRFQKVMEKHLATKAAQETIVGKARDRFFQKSIEAAQLQSAYVSSRTTGGMTPKDQDRLLLKSEKAQMVAKQSDFEYLSSIDRLTDIRAAWLVDMDATCIEFSRLEEDRFAFLRGHLWSYTNYVSAACVLEDEGCERIRVSLEKCSFDDEMQLFISENGTGREIPPAILYEPFEGFLGLM